MGKGNVAVILSAEGPEGDIDELIRRANAAGRVRVESAYDVGLFCEGRGPQRMVALCYRRPDARGEVILSEGAFGPELVVNGESVGFFDLRPCAGGGFPQLFLAAGDREAFAKVVFLNGRLAVTFHKDVTPALTDEGYAIRNEGEYLFFSQKAEE